MNKLKIFMPSVMNYFRNISIFHLALFAFVATTVFLIFFTSPKYKSLSIIDVSIEDESLVSPSFLNNIVSNSSAAESFKIKLFLESEEASSSLQSKIDPNETFANEGVAYFSKYKNKNFHKYISSMIHIEVDIDSNALSINTYAFQKEDALKLNLELINMVVNYLNRSARLSSFNSKTNKICDLYFINSDVLTNDAIFFEDDSSMPEGTNTANDLLLKKALNFKQFCSKSLNLETETELIEAGLFPSLELNKLNADASKRVLSQIYEDSIGAFASSNNITIIAEPMIADDHENRNIFLYSLLSFICSYILLLGFKIIARLSDEFYIS